MHTQYLAAHPSCEQLFAANASQNLSTDLSTYPHRPSLGKMPMGGTSVLPASIAGKMAGFTKPSRTTSDRRYRCRRASNFWQHSAFWSPLLPVRASSRSKNLSWLIQSRSAKSPFTQASTSNSHTGWASAPALTQPKPLTAEGAAWH